MNKDDLIREMFNLVSSHQNFKNSSFKKMDKILSQDITIAECLRPSGKKEPIINFALGLQKTSFVHYFLDKGADPFQGDMFGYNLFHELAIGYCHSYGETKEKYFKLIKTVTDASGRDFDLVNSTNKYDEVTLHISTCSGLDNLELIKYCVEKGADVNAIDEAGNTPLHYVIDRVRSAILSDEGVNLASIEFLLMNGADVNIKNNIGASFASGMHELQNSLKGRADLVELLKLIDYRTTSAIEIRVNNNHKNKIKTRMRNRSRIGGIKR